MICSGKEFQIYFLRIDASNTSLVYGKTTNGESKVVRVTYHPDAPKMYDGKVYNLKLQVSPYQFSFFVDGTQIGSQHWTSSPTIGRGGVFVTNGSPKAATFENFQLTKLDKNHPDYPSTPGPQSRLQNRMR